MSRTKLVGALAAAALVSACSGGGAAPAATPPGPALDVSIAVSNITNQTYVPLLLAQQLGLFAANGIDLKIVQTTGGSATTSALLSGQVDGIVGFYNHNVDLQAQGHSTESVIELNQAPGMVELVRSSEAAAVSAPGGEDGKTVGVTASSSSTEFIAEYLAARDGAKWAKVHVKPLTPGAAFVAAMQSGVIDLGVTTEPTVSELLSLHQAQILVDLRTVQATAAELGGPYPGTSLTFQTSWVAAHGTAVQRTVDALVQALHWIQTHSAQQIADELPADVFQGIGKTQYVEALANGIGVFSPTGLMPTDGPQTVLRVLSAFDSAVQGHQVNLEETYTDQFVENAQG